MKRYNIAHKLLAASLSLLTVLATNATTVIYPNGTGGYQVIQLGDSEPTPNISCAKKEIPATAQILENGGDARIIITTDIGGGDPDDIQSHIHFLMYIDRFDFEGIVVGPPAANISVGTGHINLNIDAYEKDYFKLVNMNNDADTDDFPSASTLRKMIYEGSNKNGSPETLSLTEGARKIIERARCGYDKGDNRPLYVTAWGSKTDIALALYHAEDIARVIRIVSYGTHNSTDYGTAEHNWILNKFPNLYVVDYFGSTRPLSTCGTNGGRLADFISEDKVNNSRLLSRLTASPNPGADNHCGGDGSNYLKLGDTITIAFLFNNSADERNNPANAYWGNYTKNNNSRWYLKDEKFNRYTQLYDDWLDRFKLLR